MATLTSYDKTIYDAPTFTGTAVGTPASAVPRQPPGDTLTPVPGYQGDPKAPLTPNLPAPVVAPPAATTPAAAPILVSPEDWVSKYAHLPWVGNDPSYWTKKLAEIGDTPQNRAYLETRMADAPGTGTNAGNPGGASSALGNFNFNNLFDDPATAQLLSFLGTRINQLTTPINDPAAGQLQQTIQDALAHLSQQTSTYQPQIDAIMKSLKDQSSALDGPTQQYQGIISKLVEDLSKPAFSDDQLAQLKTAAVDTLAHEHEMAIQNKVRQMGAQGIPPTSGLVQEAIKAVDQQYGQLRAQAVQAQNVSEINMVNERRSQLLTAASAGLTASQQASAQEQGTLKTMLDALTSQRSQDTASTTAGVSLSQALEQLAQSQRAEQSGNYDQAVKLASIPVDLSAQRLQQALQVLGLGGNTSPSSLLSALSLISSQAADRNNTSAANSSALWSNIGSLLLGLQ